MSVDPYGEANIHNTDYVARVIQGLGRRGFVDVEGVEFEPVNDTDNPMNSKSNRKLLSPQQARSIYLSEESSYTLADRYNVSTQTIRRIQLGRTYKKETEDLPRRYEDVRG